MMYVFGIVVGTLIGLAFGIVIGRTLPPPPSVEAEHYKRAPLPPKPTTGHYNKQSLTEIAKAMPKPPLRK